VNVDIDTTLDYYRSVRIEYVADSVKTQKGWLKYYNTIHDGYVTSFRPNEFKVDGQLMKELRITIRNQDNVPLDIKGIFVHRPLVKILAYLKPGDNFLLYGSDNVLPPAYDIAYFENKIPPVPSEIRVQAPENLLPPEKKDAPLFENKLWLWAIMGLMVGGLGFFTIKMMKGKG
jgi:hypothetical protein